MTYPVDYTCQDCGEHHYLDCSVPSAIWNQIADEGTALCAKCIDRRLVAKGLSASCRFYFVGEALIGDLYGDESESAGALTLSREDWIALKDSLTNYIDGRVGRPEYPIVMKATALRARIAAWLEAGA